MAILKKLGLSLLITLLKREWVREEIRKLAARTDNTLDDTAVGLFILQADKLVEALEKLLAKPAG